MLPTQPSERATVRVFNQLNLEYHRANSLSQRGIGRDNRLPLSGADKLFPAQQPFAAHLSKRRNFRSEVVVTDIDVAAPGIEHRENPSMSFAAARYCLQ